MLYGMAAEQAQLFAEMGHRVRIYTPFGELIPGMAYLVRRLLENTSNDSFLRHSLTDSVSAEELMRPPTGQRSEVKDQRPEIANTQVPNLESQIENQKSKIEYPMFRNEPPTDFSQAANRQAFQEALDDVNKQLGQDYPLVIRGRVVETKGSLISRNPSHRSQVVG